MMVPANLLGGRCSCRYLVCITCTHRHDGCSLVVTSTMMRVVQMSRAVFEGSHRTSARSFFIVGFHRASSPKSERTMNLIIASFLLLPSLAFQSRLSKPTTTHLASSTIPDHLVTKEANVKEPRRTKPTIDPFNPEFDRIQVVPYNQAFPSSTKEYQTV